MKSNKIVKMGLIAGGILIILISLLADILGIGSSPSFGYRQIIGVIAGVVIVGLGLIMKGEKSIPA